MTYVTSADFESMVASLCLFPKHLPSCRPFLPCRKERKKKLWNESLSHASNFFDGDSVTLTNNISHSILGLISSLLLPVWAPFYSHNNAFYFQPLRSLTPFRMTNCLHIRSNPLARDGQWSNFLPHAASNTAEINKVVHINLESLIPHVQNYTRHTYFTVSLHRIGLHIPAFHITILCVFLNKIHFLLQDVCIIE